MIAGILSMVAFAVIPSCGDNEDFSNPHILTDAELKEMLRQKHIADSLAQIYQVDTMFVYDVTLVAANNWDHYEEVNIDIKAIAAYMGLTSEELQKAMFNTSEAVFPGVPDVTLFAIDSSTRKDNMREPTSASWWGHWWNAKCDVTDWGTGDGALFTEYWPEFDDTVDPIEFTDPDNGIMNVGQMPGVLEPNQEFQLVECIKYEGYRVGISFMINVIGE